MRYLDFNDSYRSAWKEGVGYNTAHPSSGNLPTALAVGEANACSGSAVIAALVAGYEVQLRLCDFAGKPCLRKRGWHNTANLAYSTAAIASRLLSLPQEITAHAMAISASHQNTLAQLQEGSVASIKATADGWVAKGGIEATLMAREGLTGPQQIFEGPAGWGETVAGEVDYEGLLAPLDGTFRISRARIKPFAAVGPAMAPIQAAVDLYEQGHSADNIDHVVVKLPQAVFSNPITCEARRYPATREAADHSIYYCVAIALLEGNCSEPQYAPDKLNSQRVRGLLTRIKLEADAEFTALQAEANGGGVEIVLKDDTTHERRYPIPPGHPKNPLSEAQLDRKFKGLTEHLLSKQQQDRIASAVRELDLFETIAEPMAMLSAPSG
jgi:2-methylcitrate dehydratase